MRQFKKCRRQSVIEIIQSPTISAMMIVFLKYIYSPVSIKWCFPIKFSTLSDSMQAITIDYSWFMKRDLSYILNCSLGIFIPIFMSLACDSEKAIGNSNIRSACNIN